jgi:hypothetical protein
VSGTEDRQRVRLHLLHILLDQSRIVVRAERYGPAIKINGAADAQSLDWARLTYVQTAAVRAALSETYAPNTTKRMFAALRGVLKESWRLGRMTQDEYARAADFAPVRGQLPPRGRALNDTELEHRSGLARPTTRYLASAMTPFCACSMVRV